MARSTLILVPTEGERQRLEPVRDLTLCGFGPVAAAARTAHLLAVSRPTRVILVGIAGTLDAERAPIGTAWELDEVSLDGVGAGEGVTRVGPLAMDLPQWDPGAIFDHLELDGSPGSGNRKLLTVCSASASAAQAEERRARFPGVIAEDMEGFAVALAARMAQVPVRIVRGISNLAGDRTRENWDIPAALDAVALKLREILGEGGEA